MTGAAIEWKGEACNCGFGGFHEPLNKRCAAYDPSHPDLPAEPDAGDVEALANAVYRSREVNLPLSDPLDA